MNEHAVANIVASVESWPGISVERDERAFGGRFTTIRLGKREIGHLHHEGFAHIPFPRKVRDELYEAGRARPHSAGFESHVETTFSDSEGTDHAVAILRMSYDRATNAVARRAR